MSLAEVERNILILMGIYDQKILNSKPIDVDVAEEWGYSLRSHLENAFGQGELFSREFVLYYEIWFLQDDDPIRLVDGSRLNDFCLSQKVYEKIKLNRVIFQNDWEGDAVDLWESAVSLFEKYDKQPFSKDRYYRKFGG